MPTVGETTWAGYLQGAIKDLKEIDFFTSETFIKRCIQKIKDLAVDGKLLMPESNKRAVVLDRLVEAAAYFENQWKGAGKGGDRTAYKIVPEVVDKLRFILTFMDIPIEEASKQMPPTPEPAAQVQVPPPPPAAMVESPIKPSQAPAVDKEPREKPKESFFKTKTGKMVMYGGGAALAVVILGAVAAASKKKR